MQVFGYTVVRVTTIDRIETEAQARNKVATGMIGNLLAANAKLSQDRCLWCGRTREGALRVAETPKGAAVAV